MYLGFPRIPLSTSDRKPSNLGSFVFALSPIIMEVEHQPNFNSGSTISTLFHDKINPKDCQVLFLGDSGFLHFFKGCFKG